jgi:hypothetical protein
MQTKIFTMNALVGDEIQCHERYVKRARVEWVDQLRWKTS